MIPRLTFAVFVLLAACGRVTHLQPEPRPADSVKVAPSDSSVADSASRDSSAASTLQRDTTIGRDTVAGVDTLAARDSVARDSAAALDSVARDTVATRDSTMATDTATADSSAAVDSTVADSAVRIDSIVAEKAASSAAVRAVGTVNVRVPAFRASGDSAWLARTVRAGLANPGWPVKTRPPLPGSILPDKRIVAFYGSSLSKRMGILGQIPPDSMLAKLDSVVGSWREADPATPVQPALHFVTVVASAFPGDDNKWRTRMDSAQIEKVYGWAKRRDAILFLDIQAGHSSVMEELPRLAKFLQRPDVHLGIDPEFNMRTLRTFYPPGKAVGSLTADEINYAIDILAGLVTKHNLPPKVLVVHRFRQPMVRDAKRIKLDPRVQVVMHMDGWGVPSVKYSSYRSYIVAEPVQFTGFKLFFRHDTQKGDRLLQPMELVQLRPAPLYIQYQ